MADTTPSFASNSTVPLSRHFRLCHWPFSIFSTTPPGTISLQRNLGFSLALAVSSSSIFLSITLLYLLTGKHRIFYSPTSILGGTFSIVQRRACLLPFPLSQSGRADGGVYYNRHLDKGSIFPWVKKGPDTIFFRSFPTSPLYTLPPRTQRSRAQNGPPGESSMASVQRHHPMPTKKGPTSIPASQPHCHLSTG